MTHVRESLYIMEGTATTTFGKQTRLSISRNFAIFIVLFFIACLVTTGLLVYRFSSCSANTQKPKKPEVITCKPLPHHEVISSSTTEETSVHMTDVEVETTTESVAIQDKTYDVRLPRSIVPVLYDIKLIPFIFENNFTFHGTIKIFINVTEATNNITLHAADLLIDTSSIVVLKKVDGTDEEDQVSIRDFSNDTKRQFFIINLEEELNSYEIYSISMEFKGILSDGLQGFYRSSYRDGNSTRWLAATQFQPTDARKAFPCFDEPALKARFKISLARPNNMTSLSNMPIMKTEDVKEVPDYSWDHYQESVPMSTYLVAFVISDFDHISKGSFSIWSRKSAINQAKYALEIGPKVLKHYEDFFQIKFPLPKIDMIALPDFSGGAMENWGLITYRESVLLFEEGVSTRYSLQNIAIVVAHELAHQWFGNLVTPVWWTDLWLNEGFASYLEYIGTDAVKPDWKIMDQFVVTGIQYVFALDALKSSHQISVVVNNPDEINNIFDRISYEKGAAIIRMMMNFLTSSVFKKGLSNYLNERKYGNAEQDDLWAALTEQAHKDNVLDTTMTVKEIMDTWTLQVGFPVVTAERIYVNNASTFKQQRFLLDKEDSYNSTSLWWVPVTYTNKNNQLKYVWMKHEESIIVDNIHTGPDDWLLLNVNQTGYYRVNYDDQNWKMLIEQLQTNHNAIDPKNRAQLIDDALNLASAGYLNYDIALNLTTYLFKEKEYVPWMAAFKEFDYLLDMFEKTQNFDKLKLYMLNISQPLYNLVGFKTTDEDSQLTVYTRMKLMWRSCRLGHRNCIMNAVTQFQNWKSSPDPDNYNPVSPDLKSIVYCNAIKVGGQEEWDFAWSRYLNANVGSEKEIIMSALGCSRETWILYRYLEWAISDNSGIRKQDASGVFASVANNVIGHGLCYKFLKDNLDRIKVYMSSSSAPLNGIFRACTSGFNSEMEVNDLKSFYQQNKEDLSVVSRTLQQSIEQGEANVKWMKKHFNNIVNWLATEGISG